MSTTIHIPPETLRRIDAEARRQNISRNRFIREACEKALADEWPPEIKNKVLNPDPGLKAAAEEMMAIIRESRTSKVKSPFE